MARWSEATGTIIDFKSELRTAWNPKNAVRRFVLVELDSGERIKFFRVIMIMTSWPLVTGYGLRTCQAKTINGLTWCASKQSEARYCLTESSDVPHPTAV